MREIIARRETEVIPAENARAEVVLRESEVSEGPPTLAERAEDDAAQNADPLPAHSSEPPAPASPPPQLRTIQMPDGHVFHVTEDQLVQLAQRGVVATAALQQAPQMPPQAPPHAPPAEPQPALARDKAADLAQRLTYGSPEDAAQAIQDLASLVARPTGPQIDPAQIRREAVAETMQHMQLQADLNVIGQEFPTIFNSRALTLGAAAELNEIRQRDFALGANRPYIDQYREACQAVAAQVPGQLRSTGDTAANPSALQAAPEPDKLERKRAAPRQPVGVSRVASLGEAEPRGSSASQVIEKMRAQRHQPAMS